VVRDELMLADLSATIPPELFGVVIALPDDTIYSAVDVD
jgi:predicted nucleotide-binding protein